MASEVVGDRRVDLVQLANCLGKVQVKGLEDRSEEVSVDHWSGSWAANLGLTRSCLPGRRGIQCRLFELSCLDSAGAEFRWLLSLKTVLILPQNSSLHH